MFKNHVTCNNQMTYDNCSIKWVFDHDENSLITISSISVNITQTEKTMELLIEAIKYYNTTFNGFEINEHASRQDPSIFKLKGKPHSKDQSLLNLRES